MLTIYKTLYNLTLEFKCTDKDAESIICMCPFDSSVKFLIQNNLKILNKEITEEDIPFNNSNNKAANPQYQICKRKPNKDSRIEFRLEEQDLLKGKNEYQQLFQNSDGRRKARIYVLETARMQAASQLYSKCGLRYEDLYFLQDNLNRFYSDYCTYFSKIKNGIQNEDSENIIDNLKEFCSLAEKFKTYIDNPLILKLIEHNVKEIDIGLEKENLEIPPDLYLYISEISIDTSEKKYIKDRIKCFAEEIYGIIQEKNDGTYDDYLKKLEKCKK